MTRHQRLALALLFLAFAIQCLTIFRGGEVDEMDTLATARMMNRGLRLYADLFSHHAPGAYFITAAALTWLGNTYFAARIVVVALELLTFAFVSRMLRRPLVGAFAAVMWAVLAGFYVGSAANYQVYDGFLRLAMFAAALGLLLEPRRPRSWLPVFVGVVLLVGALLDPLNMYPLGVGALTIALGIALYRRRHLARFLAVSALILGGGLAAVLAYFFAIGALGPMYERLVWFNVNWYANYSGVGINRLEHFWRVATSGLRVLDPKWLEFNPLVNLQSLGYLDHWAFTGVAYRLAVLGLATALALRRNFAAAAFVYVFAVATNTRDAEFAAGTGFVVMALVSAGLLVALTAHSVGGLLARSQARAAWRPVLGFALVVLAATPMTMLGWAVTRSAVQVVTDPNGAPVPVRLENYIDKANRLIALGCGDPDAIAAWPHLPVVNFMTGVRPVGGYSFVWPWVLSYAQDDIFRALDEEKAAVYLWLDGEVWGFQMRDYLAPLKDYLDAHYVSRGDGYYQSPRLGERC